MRQNGILSANDIRELEEMNQIPEELGGNKLLVNGNFVDMASAGAWTSKYGVGKINLDSRNTILEGEAHYEEILELGKK